MTDPAREPDVPAKPLKVLYLHACPTRGGSSTSLRNLIAAFPPGTVDPLVLCPEGSAQDLFRTSGIPAETLPRLPEFSNLRAKPMRGLQSLRMLFHLRRGYEPPLRQALDRFRPHLVHLNDSTLLHPLGVVRSQGYRTVLHARSTLSETPRWAWTYQTDRMRREADSILAIDESVLRTLGDQPRARVVYNPVFTEPIPTSPEHVPSPEGALRVGFVSLFHDFKGVWELLEAARILRDRKDVTFLFAGGNGRPASFYRSPGGRLCDLLGLAPDTERRMKAFVAENRLTHVTIRGFVEDVPELLRTVDLLAFPSRLDAIPRSVFEAGALGIPSVVALVHRVDDIVRDGVNALVVPERDPQALAEAILRAAQNRPLLQALGQRAREQYREQFSARRSAEAVLRAYASAIGAQPAV